MPAVDRGVIACLCFAVVAVSFKSTFFALRHPEVKIDGVFAPVSDKYSPLASRIWITTFDLRFDLGSCAGDVGLNPKAYK